MTQISFNKKSFITVPPQNNATLSFQAGNFCQAYYQISNMPILWEESYIEMELPNLTAGDTTDFIKYLNKNLLPFNSVEVYSFNSMNNLFMKQNQYNIVSRTNSLFLNKLSLQKETATPNLAAIHIKNGEH